jgi:dihydrolipoamide dehydrogenase
MAEPLYDLIVVGGGPGGYTAAIRATQLGMRAAVVEKERLGGVCLNWGCIPTKALLKNAEILHAFRKAEEWGITYDNLQFDFGKIIKRSRGIADRISKGVEYLMRKNKIDTIMGTARLTAPGKLEITAAGKAAKTLEAEHIILATGARPRIIPGVAFDRKRVIAAAEAMSLAEQPKSMVIIGAGAIGIEFAYFYNALRTKVTVVEMLPGILPVEDRELTKSLESILKKQGIEILTGTAVEAVHPVKNGERARRPAGTERRRRADGHRRSGEHREPRTGAARDHDGQRAYRRR